MKEKLNEFARLLEHDQVSQLIKDDLACDHNVLGRKVKVTPKKKYTCVDVGTSGMYMIDNQIEVIYGIKAYGTPHKGQMFGTLDTIYNYYWGNYRAVTESRKPITEYKSAESVLASKGVYIDENGRLYGGEYGEKQEPVLPKPVKEFGSDRYSELERDLKKARILAIDAAERVYDTGTCNMDGIFLTLKGFKEDKTIESINNSGLSGFKTSSKLFGTGYLINSYGTGQAYKNEVAAETMYKYMDQQGYDVCHWQQMD